MDKTKIATLDELEQEAEVAAATAQWQGPLLQQWSGKPPAHEEMALCTPVNASAFRYRRLRLQIDKIKHEMKAAVQSPARYQ